VGSYSIIVIADDPQARPGVDASSALIVGCRTAINEFNNIRAAGGTIRIGDDCLISQFVSIVAVNHSIDVPGPMHEAPWDQTRHSVDIGNDVWIGSHAVILPGVRIGTGSVVAAGAVVTHDVGEYSVVAGVPAQFKRIRKKP
jgi:acetyltransferase-like isoleucine patch superfamily enzyme